MITGGWSSSFDWEAQAMIAKRVPRPRVKGDYAGEPLTLVRREPNASVHAMRKRQQNTGVITTWCGKRLTSYEAALLAGYTELCMDCANVDGLRMWFEG